MHHVLLKGRGDFAESNLFMDRLGRAKTLLGKRRIVKVKSIMARSAAGK